MSKLCGKIDFPVVYTYKPKEGVLLYNHKYMYHGVSHSSASFSFYECFLFKKHNTLSKWSDLSSEAKILAALNHSTIIKLCGTTRSSSGSTDDNGGGGGFSQGPRGYFLIVDRLFKTLDQRIQR